MGNPEAVDGDKLDQEQINLYLANAIYDLTEAIGEVPAPAKPKAQPRKQVAPKPQNRFQALPLPAYAFIKSAALAMLQEIMNFVRRA
jgi:hypothetical protein